MKRSSSATSSSPENASDYGDLKPKLDTPPPKKKNTKGIPKTPTPRKKVTAKANINASADNGEWTPEKKAKFMNSIIELGYKHADLGAVAAEVSRCLLGVNMRSNPYLQLGMAKLQLKNQLQPGRKGNLREKAVQAVKDIK
jgi:hypothetical protein